MGYDLPKRQLERAGVRFLAACFLAVCLSLSLTGALSAHADEPSTLTVTSAVDSDDQGTLRWALTQARTNAGARIEFDTQAMGGRVIELSRELPVLEGNVTLEGPAEGVTLRKAPEAQLAAGWRHLRIDGGAVSDSLIEVRNVTFEGPGAEGVVAGVENGGIFVGEAFAGTLSLVDCSLQGNMNEVGNGDDPTSEQGYGGALNALSEGASLNMIRCVVRDNVAYSYGGGIYTLAPLVAEDCTFSGNSSMGDRPGGGALLAVGKTQLTRCRIEKNFSELDSGGVQGIELVMTDCIVQDNVAGQPETLAAAGGVGANELTMTGCQVLRNSSEGAGGGIYSSYSVDMEGCTVAQNKAKSFGVGMFIGRKGSVRNCSFSENTSGNVGGAIAIGDESTIQKSELELIGTTIEGNTADDGGGVFMYDLCTLTIADSVFAGNESLLSGGAVYGEGTSSLAAANVAFTGNKAARNGGGVFLQKGEASIKECSISGNEAGGSGGGMFARGLDAERTQIADNRANDGGGGVFADSYIDLTGCVLNGNEAAAGGGACVSDAVLVNCTLAGNTAEEAGGGLLAIGARLTNCTVSGNVCATSKPGSSLGGGLCADELLMHGTIVSGNYRGDGVRSELFVADTVNDGSGSVSDDFGTKNLVGVPDGGLQEVMASETVNGLLVGALADNGGPTKTIMITPDGPAQDVVAPSDYDLPAADQRGEARLFGTAADIGAVEVSGLAMEYAVQPFGVYRGGDATVSGTAAGPLRSVLRVEASGVELKAGEHYTLTEGSTVVTLLPAYLKTLKNGAYEVDVVYTNGRAALPLTVEIAAPTPTVKPTVKPAGKPAVLAPTGDGLPPLGVLAGLACSAAAVLCCAALRFARR